jgi:Uma2 family endonuclease
MATDSREADAPAKLADLIAQLGGVSPKRIWLEPLPGTATEKDYLAAQKYPRGKLLELVDGVLVEKAVGTRESLLGGLILHWVWEYLFRHKIGKALPGDAALRLMPGLVRVPDVSFIAKAQLPGGKFPKTLLASLYPDLAIEVLSKGNTRGEIARKLRDYFLAGTRLAWVIDPKRETAKVYHAPDDFLEVAKGGVLDGEAVLPGFQLNLHDLFAEADEELPPD